MQHIGHSSPLGATVVDGGVNFSLFSRSATAVELLFFDREDGARPARVICLDPVANHTYHYWHVCVLGPQPGQIYGYRVTGPSDPAQGMRFDPAKVLLDLVSGADWARAQQRIDVNAIILSADRNHDGYINRIEFLSRMTEAFYFVDANKDGFLPIQELQQAITGADPQRVKAADTDRDSKLSMYEYESTIAQSFDEADTDKNGLLSMQEIKTRWGSPTR